MPVIVRTPEEIFRTEKKDMYVIHSREEELNGTGLQSIRKWISETLPDTKTELLAPSEYLGFIEGGIGRELRVDFTPCGLAAFCERWETEDGTSVDPRFQCFIHPYDDWYDKYGRFVPTRAKPMGIGLTVWIHTRQGFIHHRVDAGEIGNSRSHPAMPADLWFHVPDLWPDMAHMKLEELTTGQIISLPTGGWMTFYRPPVPWHRKQFPSPTQDEIRAWFELPLEVEIREDNW